MIYENSAVQDTDNVEIGDAILANYRNLTVDTNLAHFVDLDDEQSSANIYEID